MKNITQLLKLASLVASLLALSSCGGGGGGGGGGNTLGGAAAVGTPIVGGNINVICAAGSVLTTTTSSAGAWQLTLSGQTLPCAVEISGGTINGATNTTTYHSIALTTGTVNVTPLTDLLLANLVGTANLGTWFTGLSTNPAPLASITQAQVNTALANMSAALPALTPLGTHNPITTSFTPTSGNVNDNMLIALAAAIASNTAGVTYASLLTDASAASFTAPAAGFGSALANAYTVIVALPSGYVYEGGLTWMPISTTLYAYADAVTLCSSTINGGSDWRLPTIKELTGLTTSQIDNGSAIATGGLYGSGAINGQGWTLGYTWSSTPDGGAGDRYFIDVSLDSGYISIPANDGDGEYVTCVR